MSEMAARIGNRVFQGANEAASRELLREALIHPEVAKAMMAKVGSKESKKAIENIRAYLPAATVVDQEYAE